MWALHPGLSGVLSPQAWRLRVVRLVGEMLGEVVGSARTLEVFCSKLTSMLVVLV